MYRYRFKHQGIYNVYMESNLIFEFENCVKIRIERFKNWINWAQTPNKKTSNFLKLIINL